MVLKVIQRKGESFVKRISLASILAMVVLDFIEFAAAPVALVIVTLIEFLSKRKFGQAFIDGITAFFILLIPTFATTLIIGAVKLALPNRRKR